MPHYSPDGRWWWDGMAWRAVVPQAPRPKSGMSVGAIVALVAGGVVVVTVTVAVLGYVAYKRLDASLRAPNTTAPNEIPCDSLEHTQLHYHAALQILDGGKALPIPTALGRSSTCYYWLHLHTGEPGVIHIEAPSERTFTLGDLFQVWSLWSGQKELIDATHVSTISLSSGHRLVVYVDEGGGPKLFTGDPGSIVLKDHEVITLEVAPPAVEPPPEFNSPPGF